eukprot:Skav211898  [mRNA]  locus=scaffold2021:78170:79102:- [translate_table: standard]
MSCLSHDYVFAQYSFARARMGQCALAALVTAAYALDNGDLSCSRVSEEAVISAAQALHSTGLQQRGYVYVNLDDCWQDPAGRDETGRLRADPQKFPKGMPLGCS